MKSHAGARCTTGRGATTATSRKQKMNTRSFTEAELVALDDAIAMMLWLKRFLEEQGCSVAMCRLQQDNKSTLKWINNGRSSAGKSTRHLSIRHFYVSKMCQVM